MVQERAFRKILATYKKGWEERNPALAIQLFTKKTTYREDPFDERPARGGAEEAIKTEIKDHNWLLGLECYAEAKNIDVDKQTEIDLHVQTKYRQDRIFEIKSPHLKPFVRKDNEQSRRLAMSATLADGLSELVLYLRRTDIYSNSKNEGVYGIQRPSGVIVIGYKLHNAEMEMVKGLNFHLSPHIQIITFDDLIANIERESKIIEAVKGK